MEGFVYEWKALPEISPLLKVEVNENVCTVIPNDIFTKGNQVNNAVLVTIKKKVESEEEEEEPTYETFAQVHIPIHFMLNKYENRALNDWNGTAIEIN